MKYYTINSEELFFLTKNERPDIAFVTGSRAWNQHHDKSDIDICINMDNWDEIYSEMKDNGFDPSVLMNSGSLGSAYLLQNNESTNINAIKVTSDEFENWRIATELMSMLYEIIKTKPNKIVRCSIFETLRALVKLLRSF